MVCTKFVTEQEAAGFCPPFSTLEEKQEESSELSIYLEQELQSLGL
jgi:hypothetical protein